MVRLEDGHMHELLFMNCYLFSFNVTPMIPVGVWILPTIKMQLRGSQRNWFPTDPTGNEGLENQAVVLGTNEHVLRETRN